MMSSTKKNKKIQLSESKMQDFLLLLNRLSHYDDASLQEK